jgi:hypothetical protein
MPQGLLDKAASAVHVHNVERGGPGDEAGMQVSEP